ncbi:MAG: transglycosylase SLT domain-containing protein [Acidobacteria bacterium]|nr:transglycosylase SLT domain-containing protein [Acidobacteriota bacterium]MBI3423326.1 transglycosylase SLT domain-containing protein [Acidobacteriota bacterium]
MLFGVTPPPSGYTQLPAAIDRTDPTRAEQQLRELLRTSPETVARNNYDYLLARLLDQRSAFAEAAPHFQKIVARNSPLAGYALWHLAEIARAGGKLTEEQATLQKLVAQFPDHLWRERALRRLSESYFHAGNYQAVLTTLRTLGPRRDVLPRIGEAQAALRQPEAARASFEAALTSGSTDDTALRAIVNLDKLDAAQGKLLSEAEHLRRARVLQFNRFFAGARPHWLAVINGFPQSRARAESLFQLGRNYFLENKFAEALPWYERVGSGFPQTEEGEQGFYYAGHCHQFSDQTDKAIARYEQYLQRYPKGKFIGYAHLNAIDTLRSAGRPEQALQWAQRAQAEFGEGFFGVTALFQQAKIRLGKEDYVGALADFTTLRAKNLNVHGQVATTNLPEVSFMRAYCLEMLGRFDEAITEYLTLNEGRGHSTAAYAYYGQRATARLRALATNLRAKNMVAARREFWLAQARQAAAIANAGATKFAVNQALRLVEDEKTRQELFGLLRAAYAKLPGYEAPALNFTPAGRAVPLPEGTPAATGTSHATIANELLFLGLYDEGAAELAAAQTVSNNTVAYYCARGDCANYTFRLFEPLLRNLPEDYRLELLPRELAEVFYPFPFRGALKKHAGARGVDPRFVLSIARQESSYNTRIKSAAAARGMLQFIAPTAIQIAEQLQLTDFEQDDLYEPNTAILVGAQYMKNLFDLFGSSQAAAAAYNGSEESVARWVARTGSKDVDRFVIEVAKRETKDYVFKVLNNLQAYKTIYAAELR